MSKIWAYQTQEEIKIINIGLAIKQLDLLKEEFNNCEKKQKFKAYAIFLCKPRSYVYKGIVEFKNGRWYSDITEPAGFGTHTETKEIQVLKWIPLPEWEKERKGNE